VSPVLVDALKQMEYRGYDSVGIATQDNNQIYVKKDVGNVSAVNEKVHFDTLQGNIGIGHTRWATHGKVSKENAHPHACGNNSIAVVHNGIIENYLDLKNELQKKGIIFKSETDTEVIPNLLSIHFDNTKNIKQSMINTLKQLKGHHAFVAMFPNGTLAAARFHEPLIIGLEKDGSYFVSSDILGFLAHTRDAIYLENNQFVIIDHRGMQIYDFDGNPSSYDITRISNKINTSDKGEYAHFTLKEIAEQSSTVLVNSQEAEIEIKKLAKILAESDEIYICGSGTSYCAALLAKYLFPKFCKRKVEPMIASEIRHSSDQIFPNSCFIGISQSGESADILEATNIAKNKGANIACIVNSTTSSLAHESAIVIPLNCGPEIGVAATKSFTSQLAIIYKIVDELSEHKMSPNFKMISDAITSIFSSKSKIHEIAKNMKDAHNIYILGRGIHYPIAKEGALKIKELTYIHAEGIAAGELKHGPLALMDKYSYVILINPKDSMYEDNLNNIHEVKARNTNVVGVSTEPNSVYDYYFEIPKIDPILYPLVEVVFFQLLAYYITIEKHQDPDYPRHLAKSVTVR
jgi:glucosamine--fructose-6-phosphate aminotransferase (isomerizing)